MKKLFIFILVASIAGTACGAGGQVASDSSLKRSKVTYYFTFGMGAMIGCEQCHTTGKTASFTTSTVHGVRIGRKGSVGAGIGFDAYENWKTLPLFGSGSWDLFGKTNKVFVQLNYGYASAWINKDAQAYGHKRSEGGKMINPLLGYRIQSGKVRILFSLGYKFQRVLSAYEYPTFYRYLVNDNFAPLPPSTKEIRTDMNRFVIGMAVGWN